MRVSTALTISLCPLVLSGCSAITGINTTNNPTSPSPSSTATIHGTVHGGQNPVSGAHVYLYAVGGTGYGGPSVSLLTSGTKDASGNYYVTTDSNGVFGVTGDYTCPVANAYPTTYLLAIGGNSGSGSNSAISLVAPAGDCTSANYTSEYVIVNEITTIASVYAASGFIADLTHVSAPNTAMAKTGLGNIDTGNLYDVNSAARTTTQGGNGTVPQAEINTLANILAACVNSNGAVTGPTNPSPCYTLFSSAPSGGRNGTVPTDTATAALNIARNPGSVNIANLFGLQTANSPFQPDLSGAPNDFTIAITYTGGGLNDPWVLAVDGSGSVWAANGKSGTSISKFGSDGTPLSPSTGFTGGGLTGTLSLAIDASGNVWVPGNNDADLSEFKNDGTPVSTSSGFTGGGLYYPFGIGIDASGNVWLANTTPEFTLSEFNSSGSAYAGSPFANAGNPPGWIAFDVSGNLWTANGNSGDTIGVFNPATSLWIDGSPITDSELNNPLGMAIDANGNFWVASANNNALVEFNSSGVANPSSPFTGGGLDAPLWLAIDGSNNIWVANNEGNSISEFNSKGAAITGSTGYQGGLDYPAFLAIDPSGNIWVANSGNYAAKIVGNNTITEFVGLATPVVTPIVANLLAPYGSHAVNKP